MKNQRWSLVHIDAFAGTGEIRLHRELIEGSARRALAVRDKPFDRLVFIEKNRKRCRALEKIRKAHPSRDIEVFRRDANTHLQDLRLDRGEWRGVLFLDPFGAQVEWQTIERVAALQALDCWILFPTSTIQRMLPRSKKPDDVDPGWVHRLNLVYGNENWRSLYRASRQIPLLGDRALNRDPGTEGLLRILKERFADRFEDRFLTESRSLRDSKNRVRFELLFLVGSHAGIEVAKRIARFSLGARS